MKEYDNRKDEGEGNVEQISMLYDRCRSNLTQGSITSIIDREKREERKEKREITSTSGSRFSGRAANKM